MQKEFIGAIEEVLAADSVDWGKIVVDAVRQTDDPQACLRQTWRFVILQARRNTSAGRASEDPNIAWMHARCEACGMCAMTP